MVQPNSPKILKVKTNVGDFRVLSLFLEPSFEVSNQRIKNLLGLVNMKYSNFAFNALIEYEFRT